MKRLAGSFGAIILLSQCSTTDLPYAYDGASGYERFSVPITLKFPESTIKNQTMSQIGSTNILETPIQFSIVMQSNEDVIVNANNGDVFGIIDPYQPFVGLDAFPSTINWGATLFGMGLADMSEQSEFVERIYCTRLRLPSSSGNSRSSSRMRFGCFRDTDDDGLMDEVHTPFNSSVNLAGYLPYGFMKKVSASFTPFKLEEADGDAMGNSLTLIGWTNRNRTESWVGTRTDEYYTFSGSFFPRPGGLGQTPLQMTTILPAIGTKYVTTAEWLRGTVFLERDDEEKPWKITLVLPESDVEASITLEFDIG